MLISVIITNFNKDKYLYKSLKSIDDQKYFEIHHTQKDVFEAIHPREMELGTASMASLVYLIDKYGL